MSCLSFFLILGFIFYIAYLICKYTDKLLKYIIPNFKPDTEHSETEYIDISDDEEIIPEQNEPLSVKITGNNLDANKIQEYKGEIIKQFEYRPDTFKNFIGQEEAKEQAKTIMKKIKRGIRGHLFLSARQGMGKSTFISILAKELNAKLITRVGRQIEPDELINVINDINTCKEKYVIFLIDEIDSMDTKIIKILNPIIEQFEISGKKIKPFLFATATISKDKLIKNNPDTLDRIPHHIHLIRYTIQDIKNILTQYKNQLYPDDIVSNKILDIIAQSCKLCPRIGNSILEDFIVEQDIKKVLKNRRIIKDGLTEIDIKILSVLNDSTRAMGANATALRAGLTQKQYTEEFEPFLYEFGYIDRVPSRVLSKKGKKLLEVIK